MDLAPIVFDSIAPIEIPVKIGEKDYILREATAAAAARWQDAQMACSKMDPGLNTVQVVGLAGTQTLLVSLCLVEVIKDEKGEVKSFQAVPESTVKSWPAKVQRALFERAKEISGLQEGRSPKELEDRIAELEGRLAALGISCGEDDPEAIQGYIHALQKKLAGLRGQPKNSPGSFTPTSLSPGSSA